MGPHRAGKWRFLHEHYGKRTYWVRRIGHVSVCWMEPKTTIHPSPRPWHLINWGRTFDTPEAALEYAIGEWDKPAQPWDDSYARQEALMCGPGRFEQP